MIYLIFYLSIQERDLCNCKTKMYLWNIEDWNFVKKSNILKTKTEINATEFEMYIKSHCLIRLKCQKYFIENSILHSFIYGTWWNSPRCVMRPEILLPLTFNPCTSLTLPEIVLTTSMWMHCVKKKPVTTILHQFKLTVR